MEVTSRLINHDEPAKAYRLNGVIEIVQEDVEWEDTITVPVTLPRAAWKMVQACSEQSGCSAAEVISDFASGKLATMLQAVLIVPKED